MKEDRFKTMVILLTGFYLVISVFGQTQLDRERQFKEQLSSITPPETVFDSITFSVSGEMVTLRGFTNLPSRAKDSERAIRSLPWVEEVINEIQVTSLTSSDQEIRATALSILINQIPRDRGRVLRSWRL